jgi:hypothetical protein
MVALLFATVVMAVLTASNVRLMTGIGEAREARERQAPVPSVLAGWNARNASEWTSNPDARDGGILFAISVSTGAGSFAYWRDLAVRIHAVMPSVRLVGFCVHGGTCGASLDADSGFTVLEAMDPAFVHNLVAAAEGERILVFRGSNVVGSIRMSQDTEHLLQQIAKQFPRPGTGVGA